MSVGETITVGVDLGGTSIRVGLFDEAMQLIVMRSFSTRVSSGAQAAVDDIAVAVAELFAEARSKGRNMEQAIGIGIGSPGPINLRTGVLGLLPNLPGWQNFPLRDALSQATNLPVYLESDANAAALAEWKLGAGRETGSDTMVMITLGTGVGSGFVLQGQVWHGMFGMGGELGHSIVEPGGLLCGCGSFGCLEMYASANGLIRIAAELGGKPESTIEMHGITKASDFTPAEVAGLAELGDATARQSFDLFGRYLGRGLANLISTIDPSLIVIGGGVANAWPFFASAMFEAIWDNSIVYRLAGPTQRSSPELDRTFICRAALGSSAGLLGAGLLPRHQRSGERHQHSKHAP